MTGNGSALSRYVIIISLQKLTQVIKPNTPGFLRIQRHNSKIPKRILKRQLKQTGIDQKRFPELILRTCEMSLLLICRF